MMTAAEWMQWLSENGLLAVVIGAIATFLLWKGGLDNWRKNIDNRQEEFRSKLDPWLSKVAKIETQLDMLVDDRSDFQREVRYKLDQVVAVGTWKQEHIKEHEKWEAKIDRKLEQLPQSIRMVEISIHESIRGIERRIDLLELGGALEQRSPLVPQKTAVEILERTGLIPEIDEYYTDILRQINERMDITDTSPGYEKQFFDIAPAVLDDFIKALKIDPNKVDRVQEELGKEFGSRASTYRGALLVISAYLFSAYYGPSSLIRAFIVPDERYAEMYFLSSTLTDVIPTRKKELIGELAKAALHADLPLDTLRERFRMFAGYLDKPIMQLDREELLRFLSVFALFVKAEKEGQRMKEFEVISEQKLSSEKLTNKALELAKQLEKSENVNLNKLRRLAASLSASRDAYEALAHLARFYRLSGVPGEVINDLVGRLGQLELSCFKELVARGLMFYEAKLKGWEG